MFLTFWLAYESFSLASCLQAHFQKGNPTCGTLKYTTMHNILFVQCTTGYCSLVYYSVQKNRRRFTGWRSMKIWDLKLPRRWFRGVRPSSRPLHVDTGVKEAWRPGLLEEKTLPARALTSLLSLRFMRFHLELQTPHNLQDLLRCQIG